MAETPMSKSVVKRIAAQQKGNPTGDQSQGERLLPCPFCGRKAMIEEFRDGDDPQPLFVATCEVCPVKTYDQFTAQEAARVWNARATVVRPQSLFPQSDWQHVQIKAGNPRVVAIQFETAEQATAFINTFAATSSPAPAESDAQAKAVYSKDVLDALSEVMVSFKGKTLPVSDVGYAIYQRLLTVPEFVAAAPADNDAESLEVRFCWVCRSNHRLVASECRAMDSIA